MLQKSIRETLEILTCSSEDFHAGLSAWQENAFRSQMNEAICFLSLQESLKPSDLGYRYPKYFIFENVPGLLSAQAGYCFAKIFDALSEGTSAQIGV